MTKKKLIVETLDAVEPQVPAAPVEVMVPDPAGQPAVPAESGEPVDQRPPGWDS